MDPPARVEVLLVRQVGAFGIADLRVEVAVLLVHVGLDRVAEGPLGVGVHVHLDDSVGDRLADLVR